MDQPADLTDSQPPLPTEQPTQSSELPSKEKKRRRAVTDAQRRALRRRKEENQKATQQELITWFLDEFNHKIGQSTVSESLGNHYAYLDNDKRKDKFLTQERTSKADFPNLEGTLFEWQQRMQKKKAPITGETRSSVFFLNMQIQSSLNGQMDG